MRTLILTCNTGEGHNSSAAAIREVFEDNGEFCELRDSLSFGSNRFSKIIGKGHVGIYRHSPKLFDKGYAMSEKHDSYFSRGSVFYKVLTRGVKRLYEYVCTNKIDNIICVHPFSALLVTELKKKYELEISTSFVATDYTCAPGASSSDMDRYFIPHALLADEFVSAGIPREKLYPSGIAISQTFYKHNNKDSARDKLNLPRDKKIILLCCGSMGCGPIDRVAMKISEGVDENTVVVVVCGSNKRLYNKLVTKQSDRLFVVGYTKEMCEYMHACDVFLTKAGGISTTEASILAKPMIFVNAVAGCELRNREFFKRIDCAVTVTSNDEIPSVALSLIDDSTLCEKLSSNLSENFGTNAAKYIFDTLKENNKTTF